MRSDDGWFYLIDISGVTSIHFSALTDTVDWVAEEYAASDNLLQWLQKFSLVKPSQVQVTPEKLAAWAKTDSIS